MLQSAWNVPRYLNGTVLFLSGDGMEWKPWICRRVLATHSGFVTNTFAAPAVEDASTCCHTSGMGEPANDRFIKTGRSGKSCSGGLVWHNVAFNRCTLPHLLCTGTVQARIGHRQAECVRVRKISVRILRDGKIMDASFLKQSESQMVAERIMNSLAGKQIVLEQARRK